jgi:FixJ family two-component response regulator
LAQERKTMTQIHAYKGRPLAKRIGMPTKRKVIAVIDDSLGILSALGRLLSTLGYDTELYASNWEFLDARMITAASCLILDVHLGESSGLDLAEQLANTGCKIPFIFMSSDPGESVKERAGKIGALAFLIKPFGVDELVKALALVPPRRP